MIVQVVSNTITKGVGQVTTRKGRDSITLKKPKENITYQQHMDSADGGDQQRVMGATFANVAHFKKCYKKKFLGIYDSSFLHLFAA